MDLRELWDDVHGPYANDPIWTDSDLAAFYGLKEGTVRKKRCEGTISLPYVKRGHKCMYRPADAGKELAGRMKETPTPKAVAIA